MTTRLPNIRYLGDGCYASHDGHQFILETSNRLEVTNRIDLDSTTLEGCTATSSTPATSTRSGSTKSRRAARTAGRTSATLKTR
jgi:hypothetical protein